MTLDKIRTVGVAGTGSMGAGIIQVAAQAGFQVRAVDLSEASWQRAQKTIRGSLERMAAKGRLAPEQVEEILARISFSTDAGSLAGVPFVFEAVFEDAGVKREFYGRLDAVADEDAVYASNTSSLSITELAAQVKNPGRFVGMHFFNPVPMMKLVEVIPGLQTEPGTVEAALAMAKALDKAPITCKDTPGFVLNRLLVPYMLDAVRLLEQGVASAEDIDTAMKLGAGMPMGPFELMDFTGVEIAKLVGDIFYDYTKEPRFAPPVLLQQMVKAGRLGRKTGRGFYEYPAK
jgi:3-hydroxybutyryl-CoA dehydrogenase